jgi:hypothetical protein
MIDFQTSIFHDFYKHQGIFSLLEVILSIKNDKFKVLIDKIQQFSEQGKKEEANKLKKGLPGFTPSGVFPNGRRAELIQEYYPVICLDFDNVNEALPKLRKIVDALPTTFASFISPRGNGLKVFVITNSTLNSHVQAFNQVADEYEKLTGVKSDRSVKDVSRLCFLSYDPDLYINNSSKIFEIEEIPQFSSQDTSNHPNYSETFANCVINTQKNGLYINGNRNNFIFRLAKCCKISGIPFEECLMFCAANYDLENKELVTTIRSAFNHNNIGFADFADFAPFHDFCNINDNPLASSPTISLEDYELMPEILKTGVLSFIDPRERDVYFTGALSILSGCLPSVKGQYNRQTVFPNLFSFVIAPPASGKGTLKYSRELGTTIQSTLLQSSRENQVNYKKELQAYKNNKRKKSVNAIEDPPKPPPYKVFYIPANSSYAKIICHLNENDGTGVICETEADTMGYILKQDWGSYSDMLRKAFHHETISCSRKTDNEYMEVINPRLSVALTGTPGQIEGLIASADDGLFSRFLFYVFKANATWHDVSPHSGLPNLSEIFSQLSVTVYEMKSYLKRNPTNFILSKKQWETLNESFTSMLSDVTIFNSHNAASIVKRLGLLLYRIAMILTSIRKYESNSKETDCLCTDEDFQLSLRLSRLYLRHSLIMFNNLPKEKVKMEFSETSNKQAFFNELPNTFSRGQAITLGNKHQLGIRSTDGLLKKLLESKLKKVSNGMYQKT